MELDQIGGKGIKFAKAAKVAKEAFQKHKDKILQKGQDIMESKVVKTVTHKIKAYKEKETLEEIQKLAPVVLEKWSAYITSKKQGNEGDKGQGQEHATNELLPQTIKMLDILLCDLGHEHKERYASFALKNKSHSVLKQYKFLYMETLRRVTCAHKTALLVETKMIEIDDDNILKKDFRKNILLAIQVFDQYLEWLYNELKKVQDELPGLIEQYSHD
jgi:hypothetical protein